MIIRPQHRLPLALCGLIAGLTLSTLPLAAAAPSANWETALASLKGAGFQAVEELEVEADGGFEAEVFDSKQQAFEIVLDATGAIRAQRLEAQTSAEERIQVDAVERLVAWLGREGYRKTTSIAADDGHIEVETEDAGGHNVDLDVEIAGEGFRVIRSRKEFLSFLPD